MTSALSGMTVEYVPASCRSHLITLSHKATKSRYLLTSQHNTYSERYPYREPAIWSEGQHQRIHHSVGCTTTQFPGIQTNAPSPRTSPRTLTTFGLVTSSSPSSCHQSLEPEMPIKTSMTSQPMSRRGSPSSSSSDSSTPHSPSTLALLSLTQDITALISLSVEATASLVHDWFKSALGMVGAGDVVRYQPRGETRGKVGGEAGRGLAVVVVGANEATGQSLTLHLARSGYTVFPLVPLPAPDSPPAASALSSLLLTWSGMQKRLRARYPSHPGVVVPVITDPETFTLQTDDSWNRGPKRNTNRFAHAGETVRAYCLDNGLSLTAVVCASRTPKRPKTITSPGGTIRIIPPSPPSYPDVLPIIPDFSPNLPSSALGLTLPPRLPPASLALTDEQTLLSLYRTNVMDPLSVIRELSDLLAVSRGRVVFVNGGAGVDAEPEDEHEVIEGLPGAMQMIGAARAEAAKLLRAELGDVGIDVCEVVVAHHQGPMSPRSEVSAYAHRQGSDDSIGSDSSRKKLLAGALASATAQAEAVSGSTSQQQDAVLASRLALLSKIFAVDDALLYSSVRRAIEDRYPRYRHHAGLSPLLASIADITPGGNMVKVLGRWVVARLLRPRGERPT